jgi:hypothetical protein
MGKVYSGAHTSVESLVNMTTIADFDEMQVSEADFK